MGPALFIYLPPSISVPSVAPQDNPLMPIADEHMIPVLGLDVWEVRQCRLWIGVNEQMRCT